MRMNQKCTTKFSERGIKFHLSATRHKSRERASSTSTEIQASRRPRIHMPALSPWVPLSAAPLPYSLFSHVPTPMCPATLPPSHAAVFPLCHPAKPHPAAFMICHLVSLLLCRRAVVPTINCPSLRLCPCRHTDNQPCLCPLPLCSTAPLPRCPTAPNATIPGCPERHDTRLPRCPSSQLPPYLTTPLAHCPDTPL